MFYSEDLQYETNPDSWLGLFEVNFPPIKSRSCSSEYARPSQSQSHISVKMYLFEQNGSR